MQIAFKEEKMFNKKVYVERREELCKIMKKGIGVFLGNGDSPKNYLDNCYEFSQDSTFLYYFGLNRANLVAVIDFSNGDTYISGVDFTLDDMIWMGEQKTILECSKEYGINKFIQDKKLKEFILDKSEGTDEDDEDYYQEILYIEPYRADLTIKLAELLDIEISEVLTYSSLKLKKAVIQQRNIKSQEEIVEIERAVNITREMHLKAMEIIRPDIYEYEIKAEVEKVAEKYNCTTSFQTIATIHGETLHNHNYNNLLKEGDILLLDCGARTELGYCGDMTTVIPVSGKFSEKQKEIYGILIEMFDAAVSKLKPEVEYREAYLASSKVLIEGMKRLGMLTGQTEEILEKGAHALFFPHGLGHMLGMDVHDCENLGEEYVGYDEGKSRDKRPGHGSLRLARTLKVGHVFTVEPGIYFIPRFIENWKSKGLFKEHLNYSEIEKYSDFGGMRYEGDFVITEESSRRLGDRMPKLYTEVEELTGKNKKC